MTEPANFLLVRLDGLGDALACVPALEGLRQAYPSARFGAVCSRANATVFSKEICAVHVFDQGTSTALAGQELRAQGYTHALVATEEVAGYQLARASGARRRAGFWHGLQKPFKSSWQFAQLTDRIYRPAAWNARPEHEVETLYRLATAFGATPPAPREVVRLRKWLALQGGARTKATRDALGFQITGKLATQGWGPAMLASFCEFALRASELSAITLLAASQDQGLARSVLEHMTPGARAHTSAAPAGDVPQWFAAIDALAALITPDTGAAHAAGMLGVPVIDLFDETRFAQLSRQWSPWAAPQRCFVRPSFRADETGEFGRVVGAAVKQLLPGDVRP